MHLPLNKWSAWGRAMSESDCWANVNQTEINNVQGWLLRPAGWIKINDINDHPLNEPMTNQDQGFQMVKKKKILKREYPEVEFWEALLQNLYLVATIDRLPDTYTLSFFLT